MKQLIKLLVFFCYFLGLVMQSSGQIPEEDRELPMFLMPVGGQDIKIDGLDFILSRNDIDLTFNASAGVYQTNENVELYSLTLAIELRTLTNELSVFVDSIGLSIVKGLIFYPNHQGIGYYSLPADTGKSFLVNAPYDVTLFYHNFRYTMPSDTLDVMMYLPPIRSTQGTVLIEERAIRLRGITRRN